MLSTVLLTCAQVPITTLTVRAGTKSTVQPPYWRNPRGGFGSDLLQASTPAAVQPFSQQQRAPSAGPSHAAPSHAAAARSPPATSVAASLAELNAALKELVQLENTLSDAEYRRLRRSIMTNLGFVGVASPAAGAAEH